jgi:hypothetical protein
MSRILVLMLAAVLAACSEPRWVRPDASAEQADRDDIACQRWAANEASLRAAGFYGRPYGYGPYSRNAVSRADPPFNPNRTLDEAQLHNFCMRARGYQRAP